MRKFTGNHNITSEILNSAAARKSIVPLGTGGGCDYITRECGDAIMVMYSSIYEGECPEKLEEPSEVILFLDKDEWGKRSITFKFQSAVEAMDFMAGFEYAIENESSLEPQS